MVLVGLAALTLICFGMNGIRGILAPVLLTLVLAICAYPVGVFLRRKGFPQGLATGAMIAVVFAVLGVFAVTAFVAVGQFLALLPAYSEQFEQIRTNVRAWLGSIGIGEEQTTAVAAGIDPEKVVTFFAETVGGIFSLTGALVIVVTMTILMSADSVYLPTILRQLREKRPHLVTAVEAYAPSVRRYMVVTTVLGVAQGVLNAAALWFLNVPAALLWGLLAFLCSFIPNVGYFFALIPPLVFGFLVGGWQTALWIIIIYGLINGVVQSVIQPRVVGQAVSLSQTLTFFSVLFWAVVIGPIGAILAIPITLFLKTLLVDADPEANLWRPAFGPTTEIRGAKKAEDAERKRVRGRSRSTTAAPYPGVR
jgi:AI-2 transport protein TqsA